MAQLTVDDLSIADYNAIGVAEEGFKSAHWKSLRTPTMQVTFFRPPPELPRELAPARSPRAASDTSS
jgi:hypothetical protein